MNDDFRAERSTPEEGPSDPTPLVQGAGCSGCIAFRYYPFLRSCAYWWNQYALAL